MVDPRNLDGYTLASKHPNSEGLRNPAPDSVNVGALRGANAMENSPSNFRVALLENDSDPELVYESASSGDAIEWVREWLNEPIGLAVAVYPPGVTTI